jgi:glutathione synthase/RimK-type ligase-like ATP-grasp enzyme
MALKVAVQMDPVQSINITGDSTFAMMLEAQRRGHSLFYYQTKTLALGADRCSPPAATSRSGTRRPTTSRSARNAAPISGTATWC